MNSETTFTIKIVPMNGRLQVTIPELGITVETAPGDITLDDAERVALAAISGYHMKQYEQSQVKAS